MERLGIRYPEALLHLFFLVSSVLVLATGLLVSSSLYGVFGGLDEDLFFLACWPGPFLEEQLGFTVCRRRCEP